MHVKDTNYAPIPPEIHHRLRALSHDLSRARENLASGRLKPAQFQALSRVLDGRLRDLEAEVQFRLLNEARGGNVGPSWSGKGGRGAS